MILVEGVFKARSTWSEAQLKPELLKEAIGNEIIKALELAVNSLNAAEVVREHEFFKMGKAQFMEHFGENGTYVGTSGRYPSANMLLLVDEDPLIVPDGTYSAGTKICIVHCFWDNVDTAGEHSLPILREIYRTIRRKFVVMIEEQIRFQEERSSS